MDLGGDSGQHYGNFPEVSRFNHDCRPNVAFYVGKTLSHVTTVVRDVRAGEELAISYLDPFEPRAQRQERTQLAWGFSCGCSHCSLAKHRSLKSDKNLEEIARIEAQLSDYGARVTQETIRTLIKLYEEERLESKMGGMLTLAALNYNMLGKDKLAIKHAKLASEALDLEYGPGSSDSKSMEELARGPKSHFTWKTRLRK